MAMAQSVRRYGYGPGYGYGPDCMAGMATDVARTGLVDPLIVGILSEWGPRRVRHIYAACEFIKMLRMRRSRRAEVNASRREVMRK
jgi:hypothetical protein